MTLFTKQVPLVLKLVVSQIVEIEVYLVSLFWTDFWTDENFVGEHRFIIFYRLFIVNNKSKKGST